MFGVFWPILYTLMGTASWLVWHNGGWQKHSAALSMYVVQLALNLSWPPLFFSGHKLGLALADSTGEHFRRFCDFMSVVTHAMLLAASRPALFCSVSQGALQRWHSCASSTPPDLIQLLRISKESLHLTCL